MGNHNPEINEGLTTHWLNEKGQTAIYTTPKTKDPATRIPLEIGHDRMVTGVYYAFSTYYHAWLGIIYKTLNIPDTCCMWVFFTSISCFHHQ